MKRKFVRIWFCAVPVPYNFIAHRIDIEKQSNNLYTVYADTHAGYKEYADVWSVEVD